MSETHIINVFFVLYLNRMLQNSRKDGGEDYIIFKKQAGVQFPLETDSVIL